MEIKRKNQNKNKDNKPSKISDIEKFESYCPLCNVSFLPEKASVIDESGSSWLLHTRCSHCSSSIIMLMLVGDMSISSFGLLTDLNKDEVERFIRERTVNEDDLLDLYELLHGNNKDFIHHF